MNVRDMHVPDTLRNLAAMLDDPKIDNDAPMLELVANMLSALAEYVRAKSIQAGEPQ